MNQSPLISLQNVSKQFGSKQVLSNITLNILPQKLYVLLGKNGAGKSTLMRILMKYEAFDSGSGQILNQTISQDSSDLNQMIGYVAESIEITLPYRIKVIHQLLKKIYKNWSNEKFQKVLNYFAINTNNYFSELSRGQKMQIAFAFAYSIQPKVLLLDEVTSVLDASARSYVMSMLQEHISEGGSVVMASNIVSETQNFADHVIVLESGKLILDLSISELVNKFVKLRIQSQQAELVNKLMTLNACLLYSHSDKSQTFLLENTSEVKRLELQSLVDPLAISAEDIFLYYSRKNRVTP